MIRTRVGKLRLWIAAQKADVRRRLDEVRVIPAHARTDEQETWAANMAGRLAVLEQMDAILTGEVVKSGGAEMGKLGDGCMEDVRKARAVFQRSGDGPLAGKLTDWLERMEREPAENKPKTVALTSAFDSSLFPAFSAIAEIKPYEGHVGDACLVVGLCTYGDGSRSSVAVVSESPAQVTAAARKVWPDFDCDGAVPRLAKTVTLHDGIGLLPAPLVFETITSIEDKGRRRMVRGRKEGGVELPVGYSCIVIETPAEITIAARKAWDTPGQPWSCKGAEPPVVVLATTSGPIAFREITALTAVEDDGLYYNVQGSYSAPWNNRWDNTDCGFYVEMPEEGIIAVATTAGVPCPQAEKPEPDCGPDEFILHYQGPDAEPIICDIHDTHIEYSHTCDSMAVSWMSDSGRRFNAFVRESLEEIKGEIAAMKRRPASVPCCDAEKPEPEPDVAELETSPPPTMVLHGYDSGCVHVIDQIYSMGPSSLFPGATRVVCNDTQVGRLDLQARESVEAVTVMAQATWGTDEEFARACGAAFSPEEVKLQKRVAELEADVAARRDVEQALRIERDGLLGRVEGLKQERNTIQADLNEALRNLHAATADPRPEPEHTAFDEATQCTIKTTCFPSGAVSYIIEEPNGRCRWDYRVPAGYLDDGTPDGVPYFSLDQQAQTGKADSLEQARTQRDAAHQAASGDCGDEASAGGDSGAE